MKLKTLSKEARAWKKELRDRVRPHERDDTAVLAWEIVGGVLLLLAAYGIVSMMPEFVRYLKIKRM